MPTRGVVATIAAPGTGISYCSVDDMREEVMAMLDDKPFEDTLDTGCNASATTLVLTSATGDTGTTAWSRGNVGEFQDNGEQFIVAADPASTSVTVRRGYNNTTRASHAADTVIRKGFTYSYDQVTKAITNEINGLWPDVWATLQQTVTPSATQTLFELNADFEDLVRVTQQSLDSVTSVRDLTRSVVLEREVASGIATTNNAIRFRSFDNLTNSVIVTYRAKLSTSTVECGLMSDVVVLGAVSRLVRSKAIPAVAATDTQSDDNAQAQGVRTSIGRDIWLDYISRRARVRAELTGRHRPDKVYVR